MQFTPIYHYTPIQPAILRSVSEKLLISLLFMLSVCIKMNADQTVAVVTSPDNQIEMKLLTDNNSTVYFYVTKNSENIIAGSKLGITTSMADFSSGLIPAHTTSASIDESYTLPSGKRSTYTNHYNEIIVTFNKSETDNKIQIIVRAYNDGIAYRYRIDGNGDLTIISESSECNIIRKDQLYTQIYSKDYKNAMEESNWERQCCLGLTSLPLLAKTNNNYVLISEAAVHGNYAAAQLLASEETGSFSYQFPGTIHTTLPFQSPWRTATIGSLSTIVESIMNENLNPPTEIADVSWINPGRAAWNYDSMESSEPVSMTNIRKYIDWAAEMGWEYFTLEQGWERNAQFSLSTVLNYARIKGIGVFLWVNQHTLPVDKNQLQNMLANWKKMGVAGLKADFWEDDSQTTIKKQDLLIGLTAENKLLLNLHACTKPTGLRRSWPHLLTSEAVLGNSYYAFNPNLITAGHNINTAIIRSSLGPTDYSPVKFADKNGKIYYHTTWAHQLALATIFESGIQHILDNPDNLRYNIANHFLKKLPVSWDDTKCLEAEMESYITIARKKGDDWYVASLTNQTRTTAIELNFLPPGQTYNAYIYKDGDCPSDIQFEHRENLSSTDNVSLALASHGGFTMVLSPTDRYEHPRYVKYEAESSHNLIPFGVAIKTDKDNLCSNTHYVTSIGKGRALTFRKIMVPQSGTYAVTFYYMADTNRYAYVKINDDTETWKEYSFTGTGSESGTGLAHKTILFDLNGSSENTIEFGNYTEFAPGLDRIVISKVEETGTNINHTRQANKSGKIYTQNKNIIIEQTQHTKYQIYNPLGQLIQDGAFNGGNISIPIAQTGVYLVRLRVSQDNFSQKIIIK